MTDHREAVMMLEQGNAKDQEQAMALFTTHVNLTAMLNILQRRVDDDNIDGIDEAMDMLTVLVERHRKGHRPGQSPPRRTYEDGVIASGELDPEGVTRIETSRFHLWLYPGSSESHKVTVEMQAKQR